MIPVQGYIIAADDYAKSSFELESLKQEAIGKDEANARLNAQIGQFEIAHETLVKQRDALIKERDEANQSLAKAVIVNRDLNAQLQQCPIPGAARKPIISKAEMLNVAGVAIPKGNAPSAAQDQNARDMMLMASLMGLNAWRGFFNLNEVKAHAAMLENNPNHLPGYGRRLGLTFFADTLNNPAVNYSDPDLKVYMEGLRKMAGAGPFIGYFDDANQYREVKNADGTLKYPKGTLERLVTRIRQYAPDIILVASLTANAAIGEYKPLFDFVEAQTFGKIGELPGFLDRKFDVFCLDARKEISADYLAQAAEILVSKNPRSIFYYVTSITDWKNMPGQLLLIKQNVTRWMSMAR